MRRFVVVVGLLLVLSVIPSAYALCSGFRVIKSVDGTCPNMNSPPIACGSCGTVNFKQFTFAYHTELAYPIEAQYINRIKADFNYGEVAEWGVDLVGGGIVVLQGQSFFPGNNGYFAGSFDVDFTTFVPVPLSPTAKVKSIFFRVSASGATRCMGFDLDQLEIELEDCNGGTPPPAPHCPVDDSCPVFICGDGTTDGDELCDDGNNVNGDGCNFACRIEGAGAGECGDGVCDITENPINCPEDCIIADEASGVLFDLAMSHNMLFSKVQDLLHIVKDLLVQLEFKTIEFTLTNYACDDQPVSFWFPADKDPYGKLHEIDALVRLLIDSIRRGQTINPGAFGTLTAGDVIDAENRLDFAEVALGNDDFRRAFECKCLAYKTLAEIPDTSNPPISDCVQT